MNAFIFVVKPKVTTAVTASAEKIHHLVLVQIYCADVAVKLIVIIVVNAVFTVFRLFFLNCFFVISIFAPKQFDKLNIPLFLIKVNIKS